jgi:hypothetical protein
MLTFDKQGLSCHVRPHLVTAIDRDDASSRIYDMNATAPVQNEGRMAEPESYADS